MIGKVIEVQWYKLIRQAERHPITDEVLPEGSRLAWTGNGFVIEGSRANKMLGVALFRTKAEAEREAKRLVRLGWCPVEVVEA